MEKYLWPVVLTMVPSKKVMIPAYLSLYFSQIRERLVAFTLYRQCFREASENAWFTELPYEPNNADRRGFHGFIYIH